MTLGAYDLGIHHMSMDGRLYSIIFITSSSIYYSDTVSGLEVL